LKVPHPSRAFSLIELLISMFVVAVLIGLLMPVLLGARAAGYRSVCATNQRQLGIAFVLYLQDNKETLPQYAVDPELSDWKYGGAAVATAASAPLFLDSARPLNRYVDGSRGGGAATQESVLLFSCPADRGVFVRSTSAATRPTASILGRGTCFKEYGTSYRANAMLLDSAIAGLDGRSRPLNMSDITTNPSRLLLLGDTAWYFATREGAEPDGGLEASWHHAQDAGNMLAVDGSTKFVNFRDGQSGVFALRPR
jgi:prepilin-type N-terminal cleavage/methylation domain-containing protein